MPRSLVCCLSLLLAWGCSDDDSPPPIGDGGSIVDASQPSPEAGTPTTDTTSTPVDSLTADIGPTSEATGETSSRLGDAGASTDAAPDPTSSPQAPDSGVDEPTLVAPDSGTSGAETTAPQLPEYCSNLPAAPVAFEEIPGFTTAEDFVFDELGNYVGVDENNNLVRISRDGQKQLWLPAIGGTAGMGILPDGSVVICDVPAGSIKRAYPNGELRTILGGLEYPNGLDIGPDGHVYVAENNAGRVRRVNPDTGEFSMVAIGLKGANGVAFSNDPGLLYVGSFEGSGVYRVEIPAPGELGVASVLSRPNGSELPDPTLACPDQEVDVPCLMPTGAAGMCQAVANVVDCFRVDPCKQQNDGSSCDFHQIGICSEGSCKPACDGLSAWDSCTIPFNENVPGVCAPQLDGSLSCREPSPCDGHAVGDVCMVDDVEGACAQSPYGGSGDLYCRTPQPCDDLEAGDDCVDAYSQPGTCTINEYNPNEPLICQPPPPCDGKSDGDACTMPNGMDGVCNEYEEGELYCREIPPCDGLTEGDTCTTYWGVEGTCNDYGTEEEPYLVCDPIGPCDALEVGDACVEPYSQEAGTCKEYDGSVYCVPVNACDGLELNAPCVDGETQGVCLDYWSSGSLECLPPPCDGADAGDTCYPSMNGSGVCIEGNEGLICDPIGPCENSELGDLCVRNGWEPGVCTEGDEGLFCRTPQPCDGSQNGDACEVDYQSGRCVADGDGLVCQLPCEGREAGQSCDTEIGPGTCIETYPGSQLQCEPPNPCEGRSEGDVCTDLFGAGTCTWVTGGNYPPTPGYPEPIPTPGGPVIVPLAAFAGDGGTPTGYGDGGVVTHGDGGTTGPEPILACRPSTDCTGKPDGTACTTSYGNIGQCMLQQCANQSGPGGIDGLGVDACGYVYASEYVVGNVWRIAPDGTTELIAILPSSWIPNIKWGRGIGGFERDVMYIADRSEGRLFGMSVGGPGVTEYYDLADPQD